MEDNGGEDGAALPANRRRLAGRGPMNLPSASVVVCTRHRSEKLKRCLEAVGGRMPAPADVIVVDNTSGDPQTREVAHAAGARYLVEPIPGLSRARNTGARASGSDVVAFVDDD